MRLTTTCLAVGLTGLIATALPAVAGDLDNGAAGGIRNYGSSGVPVPVPTTYEENYKWYLRGDLGTAFKSTGSVGVEGFPLDVTQPQNWHELSIISFGFGRYLTPNFRTEFTLDYRPERAIEKGSQTIADLQKSAQLADTTVTQGLNTSNATVKVTNFYAGSLTEDVTYQNTTFLMSGFYDFNRGGSLRPYVGGGIGIAMHQLQQNGTSTYSCYDGSKTTTPDLSVIPASTVYPGCNISSASGLQQTYTITSKQNAIGWGLAAQFSAGLTYDLTPRTHLDTGYRMLWEDGRVSVASATGVSTIRLKDQIDHEIRTGVRWDLW